MSKRTDEQAIDDALHAAIGSIHDARALCNRAGARGMSDELNRSVRDILDMLAWTSVNPTWTTDPI